MFENVPDLLPHLEAIAIDMGYASWQDVCFSGDPLTISDCVDAATNNWAVDHGL